MKDINKEFDKIFGVCGCNEERCVACTDEKDYKQFIKEVRLSDIDDEIKELEGSKELEDTRFEGSILGEVLKARNKAIQDQITRLKSKREEINGINK
jgi:hypothetical protein